MLTHHLNKGYFSFFSGCAQFGVSPCTLAAAAGALPLVALSVTGILPACTMITMAIALCVVFIGAISMLGTYPLAMGIDCGASALGA